MKRASQSLLNPALLLVVAMTVFTATTFAQDSDAAEATATIPGILPSFVVAGAVDPNGKVPAFNAVPGSGVANLAIPVPVTLLAHGEKYIYTVAFQDYNYTGSYTVSYKLVQTIKGKSVTLQSGTLVTHTTSPGDYWAWAIVAKAIPKSPGLATLEGIITYGKKQTVKTSTTVLLQ